MAKSEILEKLRDTLRTAANLGNESSDEGITKLIVAANAQFQTRIDEVGTAPEWGALKNVKSGAAGVSLILDVIALSAEAGIKRLGLAGADLDNRAHAVVDLWARSEAGRSLLMELFDQWPQGAPSERVLALKDTVKAVCIDSAARVLEGNFGSPALIPFIEEYVSLQG